MTLAILVIAVVMALLFKSARMVGIALIPNSASALFTAGVMGWTGIPIKPSTILVFSVAFGISVDDTIHFLAKYRQELQANGWNIRNAVLAAVKETGVSMMYTSIVLFFGFMMFAMSEFDGTRFVGHFGLGDPLGGDVHQPHAAPVFAHELCPVRDHEDLQRAVF